MRMTSIAAIAAALALGAGFATAESLSPASQAAKEQLAAKLGVDAGAYDYETLVKLNCRLMGADTEAEKRKLLEGIGEIEATHRESGDTAVQLATELGVNASDYSLAQLVYLKGLMEGRNCSAARAAEIIKAGERITPEAAAAKDQLAMVLGVEPSQYTLNELVKMKWEAESTPSN